MPVFICEKCGVIENTACCDYWSLTSSRISDFLWHKDLINYKGKALCSECAKIGVFNAPDGNTKLCVVPGKWHNEFSKEYPSKEKIYQMRKQKHIIN